MNRPEGQASPEQTDNEERIRDVVCHALDCPRAIAGKYQWGPLMCCILFTKGVIKEDTGRTEISFIDFIAAFAKEFAPESNEDPSRNTGELSRYFEGFAERLAYLESYRPKDRDFAVDALQGAFCGLLHSQYGWGKKGLPTKGKVIEMAKALLARQEKSRRKDWPKSAWSEFLQLAHLDWLPEGPAGRPPKTEVDEVAKAKQEARFFMTKGSNKRAGEIGWMAFRDEVKAAYGSREDALRDEAERLTESYGQSKYPEAGEESENC